MKTYKFQTQTKIVMPSSQSLTKANKHSLIFFTIKYIKLF